MLNCCGEDAGEGLFFCLFHDGHIYAGVAEEVNSEPQLQSFPDPLEGLFFSNRGSDLTLKVFLVF